MGKTPPPGALEAVYRRLFKAYGRQHWWPAYFPFEVMVGAVLTQSAAWTGVEKAIANLKNAGALSPVGLRALPLAELARLIRPAVYYNAKARKLAALASWLDVRCGDDIGGLIPSDTESLRKELLAVYGIGPETADSILLYALERPVFVIDAYTRRIVERLGLQPAETSYDGYQQLFMSQLLPKVALYNEYHALLVRLGKEVCRGVPLCERCPLLSMCPFGQARASTEKSQPGRLEEASSRPRLTQAARSRMSRSNSSR